MYDIKPNLTIGFHGCDREVCEALLMNPNSYRISRKPYEWLGHGFYFWENNYERAFQWALEKQQRQKISEPAVIGAILYLGHSCDFLEHKYIQLAARYAQLLQLECGKNGNPRRLHRRRSGISRRGHS